jgi:malate permease and related proteins
MNIFSTIIPIFAIILMGYIARKKGFIQADFIGPANALVYYLAIPAMLFNAISRASLTTHFNIGILVITLASALGCFALAWIFGSIGRIQRNQIGSYVQASYHGNLGYIGLAVIFYYSGESGLVKASILTGFLSILQNLLSVLALTVNARQTGSAGHAVTAVKKIAANPVFLSAMAGILCSLFELPIPMIIQRSLDILSGLALPMALLIIGASISFQAIRQRMKWVLIANAIKLILMPGLGFVCFLTLGFPAEEYLPGLILLASPTATVSYVMAKEMKGDPDFAVMAISASTMLSSLTFIFWLNVAG